LQLLEGIGEGIGFDCSIVPLKFPGLFMISTTDFFFPNVDDPYVQGKIGCANVLSDMYSMGIADCDTMLMLVGVSRDMPEEYRDISAREMIRGFNDHAKLAGTNVSGGQTVMNPWPLIGGVATAVCKEEGFLRPEQARAGDVLVLTKPLGTQLAVNAHQWLTKNNDRWQAIQDRISVEQIGEAFDAAQQSMMRLNRTGARLLLKYGAHACTDVTGFGLLGHARNLASNQREAVNFELHTLPMLRHMRVIADYAPGFKFWQGESAETSGGLLVALPAEAAAAFITEMEQTDGWPAWVVGRVVSNASGKPNTATLVEQPKIIEVDAPAPKASL
jgi:selenide,water dikinase